jgi:serine/threonine protein kinase
MSEVVPNGTLSSFLRARGETPLPIQKAHVILKGIAEGLQFLHTQQPPIVHRDLRCVWSLVISCPQGRSDILPVKS